MLSVGAGMSILRGLTATVPLTGLMSLLVPSLSRSDACFTGLRDRVTAPECRLESEDNPGRPTWVEGLRPWACSLLGVGVSAVDIRGLASSIVASARFPPPRILSRMSPVLGRSFGSTLKRRFKNL